MNLIDVPAYQLHEKLKKREISSVELTQAYLDRINSVDDKIRSFITIFEAFAYKMADEADRKLRLGENVTPITGIPLAIKDNICFEGYPTTCSSKMLKNFIPSYNATVVDKLIESGAVFMGKTNMDEFAMGSSNENSRFFMTYNPWDTDRVPGGSSGGSAAAVAAKESLVALGSDTGGSIRQPAAFCGVTGLKPTYGTVSRYGLVAFASSLDQIGPIARNVKDAAILLDVISGFDPMDSTSVKRDPVSYYDSICTPGINLKGLRIGYPVEFFGDGLDEKVRVNLHNARKVFEDLGAEFVEVSIPSLDYALAAYYVIAPSEVSSNLARYDGVRYTFRNMEAKNVEEMYKTTRREGFGDEVLRRIMIGTYALSSGYYEDYYLKAQKVRTVVLRDFEKAFEKCDIIFSPATPTTAFKIGEKVNDPLAMYMSDIYTAPVNLTGLPGLVIPCGKSEGLPVGLQLIGKKFDEVTILIAGSAFQEATDYHKQLPKLEESSKPIKENKVVPETAPEELVQKGEEKQAEETPAEEIVAQQEAEVESPSKIKGAAEEKAKTEEAEVEKEVETQAGEPSAEIEGSAEEKSVEPGKTDELPTLEEGESGTKLKDGEAPEGELEEASDAPGETAVSENPAVQEAEDDLQTGEQKE